MRDNGQSCTTPVRPSLSPSNPLIRLCNRAATTDHRLVVSVCMHGNEQCGMGAFNELLAQGMFDDLAAFQWAELVVCVGNPRAVQLNQRFVDVNLNRIFAGHSVRDDAYEHERVELLQELICQADAYLDLHSTSSASDPFAIATPAERSKRFAETFPVAFVIEDIVSTLQGTSMQWAFDSGVHLAVCVECGHHNDRSSIDIAKASITRFVSGRPAAASLRHCPMVLSCTKRQILQEGFRFVMEVRAFQRVEYGDVIAWDPVNLHIRCPYPNGAYIIMPTAHHIIGEEAWFWGEIILRR